MKKLLHLILLIIGLAIGLSQSFAQSKITGVVFSQSQEPLPGATVLIKGTLEGVSTDLDGRFNISTRKRGAQKLTISYVGYENKEVNVTIGDSTLSLKIVLREKAEQISDVVITAGSFEASDKKKGVTLKPLDIVTTASAAGDIYGALTSLPGTTTVGEDGRLFVRGGDAYEAHTFIDGLRVKKPYSSTTPDLPSRGRFSPFLFTGTTFSSGAYSAQYGQALSSALVLTTTGVATDNQWGFSLMSVGAGGAYTQSSKNGSINLNLDYTNLTPYNSIIKQRVDYSTDPKSIGGSAIGRLKIGKTGLLKIMATATSGDVALSYKDYDHNATLTPITLKNQNLYINSVYASEIGNGWNLRFGNALSYDDNDLKPGEIHLEEYDLFYDGKMTISKEFSPSLKLYTGVEANISKWQQRYRDSELTAHDILLKDQLWASFIEVEAMVLRKVALRAGFRGEYSHMLDWTGVAPRFSAAYLLSKNSQISVATGLFYQKPEEDLLRFNQALNCEQAWHYIANYQFQDDNRIFRIEGYIKNYKDLVRFDASRLYEAASYNNAGYGYARGMELFWRDQKTIKYLDYWLSYSWMQSQRAYRDFPMSAKPTFAPEHTVTAVGKYWVNKINTQFGMTFIWSSGRAYDDPTTYSFNDKTAPSYLDISVNASYLFPLWGKTSVLYASVSNLTGKSNIYSYRYYNNESGQLLRDPVVPEAKRFIFIGFFLNFN